MLEVVKKIVRKLNGVIDESDIDICHKIDTPNSTVKNVLVLFRRRSKRYEILAKAREAQLSTASLGFHGPSKPVLVKEHFTQKTVERRYPTKEGRSVEIRLEQQWKNSCSLSGVNAHHSNHIPH